MRFVSMLVPALVLALGGCGVTDAHAASHDYAQQNGAVDLTDEIAANGPVRTSSSSDREKTSEISAIVDRIGRAIDQTDVPGITPYSRSRAAFVPGVHANSVYLYQGKKHEPHSLAIENPKRDGITLW